MFTIVLIYIVVTIIFILISFIVNEGSFEKDDWMPALMWPFSVSALLIIVFLAIYVSLTMLVLRPICEYLE